MVFPTDPLQVRLEFALGADITGDPALWSWTDVSEYVRTADGAKVNVNRGRRNDSGATPPATMQLELDNTGGRFCTQNPNSPYFPLLQVNTPVRVSVSTDSGATWSVRFSGYLSKLPTSWRGAAGSDSWVSVTADSILRRLDRQGSRSPMGWTAPRLTSGNTGCIEYWPMEDGKDATEAVSFFPDGIPMTAAGSIEMGTSSPPSGSHATPQSDYEFMSANAPSLTGIVRPYTDTGSWTVMGIFKTDPESVVQQVLLDCDINHGEGSTDPDQVRLSINGNTLSLAAYGEDLTLLGSYTTAALSPGPNDGDWHAIAVVANQSGANITFDFYYDDSNSFGFTVANRTLGTVRRVAFPAPTITAEAELLAVGHLAIYDDNLAEVRFADYVDAVRSHLTASGERVDLRLGRLVAESDLIHAIGSIPGEVDMLERMGSQQDGNLLSVIDDVVSTDGGILYEPRNFTTDSLSYLSRSALNVRAVSTPAMTLTQNDFAIIEQEDDDHYLATSVTVTSAGSSATAVREPVENEVSYSTNVRFADRLQDFAGWALYQGTRPDYRYPHIRLLLHGATNLIAAWKTLELGDRVLISDPPPGVVDDIDLMVEGYQESFAQFSWTVELYCSPASRYRIARLDHSTYGRMDTAGSRLVNAVTSSATTLVVETTTGAEWSTSAGSFDLGVGGERMTVSAIGSAFNDTFTRTESSGWGTSTSGHAWSRIGGSATDYSVDGSRGLISIGAVDSLRSTYMNALPSATVDRTFTTRIPVLATGAPIQVRAAARLNIDTNTYYAATLRVETNQSVQIQLLRVISGGVTTLVSKTIPGLTHTVTTDFRIRFRVQGPWLYAKIWNSATEPVQWSLATYDTQITDAGSWGARVFLTSGNTNALPVVLQFDNDSTLTPQMFTVARSVNTVVKAHSAGAAVGLFQPNHLGL